MSASKPQATDRTIQTGRRSAGPGPFGAMGMPAEKAMTFWPSAKRLIGRLRPHRIAIGATILLAALSVALMVTGPKLLGEATNVIFAGAISQSIPAGMTKEQLLESMREAGQTTQADMLSAMDLNPGQGIDFEALRNWLVLALAVYVIGSLLGWLQALILNRVVNRTVYRLREEVEEKLHRLPLRYFDRMQRGELLSRVTNDVDNVQQSLNQTLSQLLNSLLTVVGVLIMMFSISWVLAVISLVTVPSRRSSRASSRSARSRSSSRSGRTPGGSTPRSRRATRATRSSRCSGARRRSSSASARRTRRCTGRASAPSSSRASSCPRRCSSATSSTSSSPSSAASSSPAGR